MTVRIRVEIDDGSLVVVKEATSAEAAARLRTEASALAHGAGPGVVEIARFADGDADESSRLLLAHAGTALSRLAPCPADELATIGATVAGALARIHDAGWVHGAVTADHVFVARDGATRLGGFGGAVQTDDDEARAADVAQLWATLRAALGPAPDGRRHRHRHDAVAGALDESPPRTARRAVRSLAALDPGAPPPPAVPRPDRSDAPAVRRPVRHRWTPRLVLTATGSIALVLALALAAPAARPAAGPAPAPSTVPSTVPPSAPSASTPSAPSTDPSAGAASESPPESTVNPTADGCGACVVALAGRRARVGALVFEVGSPTDVVVIGDWDCDGVPTPAVLRSDRTAVFVFDRWPVDGPAGPPTVIPVAAGSIVDLVGGDGACPPLLGIDRTGTARPV